MDGTGRFCRPLFCPCPGSVTVPREAEEARGCSVRFGRISAICRRLRVQGRRMKGMPTLGFDTAVRRTGENFVGAASAGLYFAIDSLVRWVVSSDSWIAFALLSKPLVDLTWDWRFFQIAQQEVNVQTFVGLLSLGLNTIVIVKRTAWRYLPVRVLLFTLCAALSVVLSPSSWGVNELLRLLAGIAFFYTAGNFLAEPERFDRFAKVFVGVASIPVVLALLQAGGLLPYTYWDWVDGNRVGRVSGTYDTPFSLIFVLIYAIPMALYVVNKRKNGRSSLLWVWVFLACSSTALIFTYHRVGYVAVALEFMICFYLSRGRKTFLAFVALLTIACVGSLGFLRVLYEPLGGSLQSVTDYSSQEFLRGRGVQWYLYLDSYISGGPIHWVLGRGGSVIEGLDFDDPRYVLSPNEPHNDFIRILHAYGAVGLIFYFSVLTLLFRRALQL